MRHHRSHHEAATGPMPERHPWALLILLCIAQFMVIIDMTVVNVALPSIGAGLRFASTTDLQWVITAYVLVSGGLVLLGGRVADLLGGRRLFLPGLVLFSAASLASGLAPSANLLIASRACQGLGAAFLTPAALSLITTVYTGRQRTVGLAVWGAMGGSGAAVGVLLGGAITSWLGWQWVFFVNVPIGAIVAGLAWMLVPAPAQRAGRLRDLAVVSSLAVVAGLVVLVYAIQGAASQGWGSAPTLTSFLLAGGLLATFVARERHAARPLVPLAIWRERALVSGAALMLAAAAIMGGAFFLNSLYLQRVLGDSALQTGAAFLPLALAIVVAGHLGSRLLSHAGSRAVLVLGFLAMAAGTLLLAQVPDRANYLTAMLPGFLVLGTGLGLTFVAVMIGAMAEVCEEHAGLASGLMTTAHEVGAALGVAILSAVATAGASQASFAIGYRDGLWVAVGIAVAGAGIALHAMPAVRPVGATRFSLHGG